MQSIPRSALVVALCLVMTAVVALPAGLPFFSPRPAQAEGPGQNLLVDGDFEVPPVWPMQDGVGEVQVATGWRAWYVDVAPSYVKIPANCDGARDGYHCYWMRPEFRDNVSESFPNRVHGGVRSQKYFSFGRMHEAGLYQQVGGITPGSTLRFSIYIQAWQCAIVNNCGVNGIKSDAPAEMHLRVGIDPTGGTNPFSGNIVWTGEQEAFDRWVEFSVTAKAASSTVTVFTHSRPEWDWARMPNDVYLDDASLVVVSGEPAAPAQPAAPAKPAGTTKLPSPAAAKPTMGRHYTGWEKRIQEARDIWVAPTPAVAAAVGTPVPTATPVVYTVQRGDSATLIARRFGITVEALLAANNITNANVVELGRQLIIPVAGSPSVTVTATLPATRSVAAASTVTRTAPVKPASTPAPTAWPQPSEASTADVNQCDSHSLLIIHTRWNNAPEPGVKFDFHSQPDNPNNDPSKFRYATNERGTAYFCMPNHTRLYFFFDRDMGFDERVELGQVVERTFDVPRVDMVLNGPLGTVYKPETPIQFSWKPYNGAAYYEVAAYGEQHGYWGGNPSVEILRERVQAPKTDMTASFSINAEKGIFAGEPLRWIVTAFNANGTIIAKSTYASFALVP